MPYAIVLKCTGDSATPVTDLWREASRFETTPSMQALNYPPHLTFAVYPDVAVPWLVAAAQKAFANVPPLSIEFSGIDHFPNEMLVLWARPVDDRVLRQIHSAIHDEIDPALCHEHSRPDRWQPHCTIAMKISAHAAEEALTWAKATPARFTLTFDAVDCVSFPPVEIIREVKLLS
ncbi:MULTISPECIES: 2'-5' RNA ligase family protein [unclassified Rhizobium]|uniref:2'-5' RNA ligase family protein n=1 Tax=unclassified Rhizobium TaxID=2613769 RepID=UPI000EA943D4|nr:MULTISPECIES: 2'-5' RNA ligase family protein [unclassified Rhizobium]AYG65309.1 2'-5' RNA ligase family protein [Rhizobium sp. CCGE531]AYG71793.1 2'-5' RNA ligase family protein [Rhizobium sp. CCGE532]